MNQSNAGNIPDTNRPRVCEWRAAALIGAWLLFLLLLLISSRVTQAQAVSRRSLFTPQLAAQIAHTANDYGLDPLLVLEVMRQESAFRISVVSPKKAAGLMQLIPATAARFGVTDPLDPQQAITGGCRYLRYLTDRYGVSNTHLILAAYNAGEQAVDKFGRKVPPYPETQNYVQSIIAAYNRAIVLRARVIARVDNPQSTAPRVIQSPGNERRSSRRTDTRVPSSAAIPPMGAARLKTNSSGERRP